MLSFVMAKLLSLSLYFCVFGRFDFFFCFNYLTNIVNLVNIIKLTNDVP